MPRKSENVKAIDDPTAQLTEADIDPIGTAQRERKPSWVGQRRGEAEDSRRDDQIRDRALDLAVNSLEGQAPSTEDIVARAQEFEKQLRGESE